VHRCKVVRDRHRFSKFFRVSINAGRSHQGHDLSLIARSPFSRISSKRSRLTGRRGRGSVRVGARDAPSVTFSRSKDDPRRGRRRPARKRNRLRCNFALAYFFVSRMHEELDRISGDYIHPREVGQLSRALSLGILGSPCGTRRTRAQSATKIQRTQRSAGS